MCLHYITSQNDPAKIYEKLFDLHHSYVVIAYSPYKKNMKLMLQNL